MRAAGRGEARAEACLPGARSLNAVSENVVVFKGLAKGIDRARVRARPHAAAPDQPGAGGGEHQRAAVA